MQRVPAKSLNHYFGGTENGDTFLRNCFPKDGRQCAPAWVRNYSDEDCRCWSERLDAAQSSRSGRHRSSDDPRSVALNDGLTHPVDSVRRGHLHVRAGKPRTVAVAADAAAGRPPVGSGSVEDVKSTNATHLRDNSRRDRPELANRCAYSGAASVPRRFPAAPARELPVSRSMPFRTVRSSRCRGPHRQADTTTATFLVKAIRLRRGRCNVRFLTMRTKKLRGSSFSARRFQDDCVSKIFVLVIATRQRRLISPDRGARAIRSPRGVRGWRAFLELSSMKSGKG
jgi:hypothetical protein